MCCIDSKKAHGAIWSSTREEDDICSDISAKDQESDGRVNLGPPIWSNMNKY